METYGGKISADNRDDGGAVFRFVLPLVRNSLSDMEPSIHIVDDDRSFRTALGRIVETSGYPASCYNSGEEFLARLPKSEAGCILLDLRMPGLSGTELQDRLGQAAPLLPIVFLTGQGTIAASVLAIKAGADDFLEKPVSSKSLAST